MNVWKRMTATRASRKIGALTGAALLAVLVQAPSASAAGCYQSGCLGKDPVAMGCGAGAYTKHEFTSNGVRYELRFGPECAAYWTRVTAPSNHVAGSDFGQVRSYTCKPASSSCRVGVYGVQASAGRQVSTAMIGTNYFVAACRANYFTSDPTTCGQTF